MDTLQLENTGTGMVLAVSGGVDSMVLLDVARRQLDMSKFVVAHMRHNVRSKAESEIDYKLVSEYCRQHSLQFENAQITDGARSEDALRIQRYAFLESIRIKYGFGIVATAHHHDDYIETAVLNILRGTNGRGLVAMKQNTQMYRPLLGLTKAEIVDYAEREGLLWHEDSTNSDSRYGRNLVRMSVIPKLHHAGKFEGFEACLTKQEAIEREADLLTESISKALVGSASPITIGRVALTLLPHPVALRVVHHILTSHSLRNDVGRSFIDKLVVFMKTAAPGSSFEISGTLTLVASKQTVEFIPKD